MPLSGRQQPVAVFQRSAGLAARRTCSPLCCRPGGWLGGKGGRRLLGQVAGEDEGDSAAWDESLPDDKDLPVWLDEHDRGLAASGQVRDERSAGAEGGVGFRWN